jgi:radical SAM superfamily enzyme YgiQ (UPF0313 family)
MKIILVYPNSKHEIIGWGDMGAVGEPLALEYLATGATADGHEVRILDLRLHPDALDETLLTYRPDILGVTGYSMHVKRNIAICRRTKELLPACQTVVGGHHATLMPEDFLEPSLDFVVQGEGVFPLRRILAQLSGTAPNEPIPGVWKREHGAFRCGGPAAEFEMDDIPQPDRSHTAADRESYYIDWMRPIALMRTTVGCPYRCSFCSLWRIMDGHYHRRSVDSVVAELRSISERYVFLVDDEPFVNSRRMKALAEAIAEARVDKEYFAYCRVDTFLRDRALMEQWRRIGLRRLFFGIESIFDSELQDYSKRQKRGQIVEAYREAKLLGIEIFSGFIINPSYGPSEFASLVAFIREHEISYPSFTILTPIPGTDATFDKVTEWQPNGRPDWDYFDLQHPVIPTKLPRDEFMQRYRDLYRVFSPKYLQFVRSDHPMFAAALLQGVRLARKNAQADLRAARPTVT